MTLLLPQNQRAIFAEWVVKEGGIHAAAKTDGKGEAYLAIKTVNRMGKTSGWYDWSRSRQFQSDMVIGFVDENPLIIRVCANVITEGVELIITPPPELVSASDFIERRFSPWGSDAPTLSITLVPTFEPLAANAFPFS